MCQFFSAIATRDGRLLFTEKDSHEEIIKRAKLRDVDLFVRHWVRLEQLPTENSLRVDETSIPSWFDAQEWQPKIDELVARVKPARAAYDQAVGSAEAAYNQAVGSAGAAYNQAVEPARAAYNQAVEPAWAAYNEAVEPARAAYNQAVGSAEAAYNQAVEPARAAYLSVLSPIEGYIGKQ